MPDFAKPLCSAFYVARMCGKVPPCCCCMSYWCFSVPEHTYMIASVQYSVTWQYAYVGVTSRLFVLYWLNCHLVSKPHEESSIELKWLIVRMIWGAGQFRFASIFNCMKYILGWRRLRRLEEISIKAGSKKEGCCSHKLWIGIRMMLTSCDSESIFVN